jgi:hypothetical protein
MAASPHRPRPPGVLDRARGSGSISATSLATSPAVNGDGEAPGFRLGAVPAAALPCVFGRASAAFFGVAANSLWPPIWVGGLGEANWARI